MRALRAAPKRHPAERAFSARLSAFVLPLLLIFCLHVRGVRAELFSVSAPASEIRPGRRAILTLNAPADGFCSLSLENGAGEKVFTLFTARPVTAGYNALYWNGTADGVPAPAGQWVLAAEMDGLRAETPVTVGPMIPALISPALDRDSVMQGEDVLLSWFATEAGTLTVRERETAEFLWSGTVPAGQGENTFRVELEPGLYTLTLLLAGEDGTLSEPYSLPLEVLEWVDPRALPTPEPLPADLREKGENGFTPVQTSPFRGTDGTLNYWTLPMDITDEEAVWKVLTAPVTVVDSGKRNAEKTQIVLRAAPSEEAEGVGVVTCVSQGVHVLERGEAWSLVECYSSSFHDSPVLNWNTLVQGWLPTAYLRDVLPDQTMGLVVDKLTQRLYVFTEGKLFSTLLVSTGIANAKQPYNETRSGEFLLVSKVGEFASDNLRCPMAIRFNDGDLLHEVPYISSQEGRFRDYSINEPKLGTKASHGCIRVQRQPTPEGVSQKWLWNHYRKNTKILIWEDWQGRQLPLPAADLPLFVQKKRTGTYHLTDRCSQLKTRTPLQIAYGDLSLEENRKLKPCPVCGAPAREETIRETNALYAPGGDHDPVLTEARKSCPRPLRKKKTAQ